LTPILLKKLLKYTHNFYIWRIIMFKISFNTDLEETDEEDYYNSDNEYEDEEEDEELEEEDYYEMDDEDEEKDDSYCD